MEINLKNSNINGLINNTTSILNSNNLFYDKNATTSPNRRFNTEYIYNNTEYNKEKNINNSKEFNNLVEKISLTLKDYFNNDNLYFKNIKLISESINEQTLFGRCSINDIFLYLNQITYPRFNGVLANMNEKYIKEKLNIINDRLTKIEQLKENMNQNIKNTEIELITFYEESKNILQKIKIFYKYGNGKNNYNENKFKNLEELDIIKDKYNKLLKENNTLKMNLKISNSLQTSGNSYSKNRAKKNFNLTLNNIRSSSCSKSCTQKYINTSAQYPRNKNSKKINIRSLKKECNNSRNKKIYMNNNVYNNSTSYTNNNSGMNLIIEMADMILKFLNDMQNLQEYIIKKNNNIKELKKNFETSKKNLRLFCEQIVNNKNKIDRIKNISIQKININNKSKDKNINNNNIKIKDSENKLIDKNNKIKNLEKEILFYKEKNNQLIKEINELNIKHNDMDNQKKLLKELDEKNNKIKNMEQNIDILKNKINDLNIKLKEQINLNNELNNQNIQIKIKENELLLLKEENNNMKIQINKYTNEIKDLNNKIQKNKNENSNKIYLDIKNILKEINEKSEKNIRDLINKDNQFDLNLNIKSEIKEKENEKNNFEYFDDNEIMNNINNFKENINEYQKLIENFKNYNNFFEQNINI